MVIMNVYFRDDLYKQAAMLMLCGLLPYFCSAQPRSRNEVEEVVSEYISKDIESLKKVNLKLCLTSSQVVPDRGLRSDKEAYYIYSSAGDDTGFVIVSGDKRMPPILAYSEESNFDADNIPPNVRYWLECYAESYQEIADNSDGLHTSSISVNSEGVAPLLGDNFWDQDDPYNRLCPAVRGEKCLTGCVATAMAQVMNYHKHPAVGRGHISYRTESNGIHIQHDLGSVYFKWGDMLDDYNRKYSSAQADAVAELMYACGTAVHMDYGTAAQEGSGAYQSDLIPAFVDNFGYDNDAAFMMRNYCSTEDWHRILVNELNAVHPVNYGGQSVRDGGHSFVFDGYKVSTDNKYPDYHVNWGWGGYCNGYYQIADLHPVENGQHGTMGGFNSSQQITIGVKPDDGIDNGVIYLCTPNLHASSTSAKPGSSIQIYTASLNNFSYKDFTGTLHVGVVSQEDGSETILGESRVRTISYLKEQNNISIDVTLPSNLSEGKYTVQLRSKQSGSEEYEYVYSKKYPELTISSTESQNPVVASETMLGCSELELANTPEQNMICLNLYELQNLLDAPFIGDLRMILADDTGKQLMAFGDSIQPGELSMFEVQEEPQRIKGMLSGVWPDGNYRLYVGARLINTDNYVYLTYYDITRPEMANQELFLRAQIKNGVLAINGHNFEIASSIITLSEDAKDDERSIYILGGFCYQSSSISRKGINIVKKSDGTIVKFMSK